MLGTNHDIVRVCTDALTLVVDKPRTLYQVRIKYQVCINVSNVRLELGTTGLCLWKGKVITKIKTPNPNQIKGRSKTRHVLLHVDIYGVYMW